MTIEDATMIVWHKAASNDWQGDCQFGSYRVWRNNSKNWCWRFTPKKSGRGLTISKNGFATIAEAKADCEYNAASY